MSGLLRAALALRRAALALLVAAAAVAAPIAPAHADADAITVAWSGPRGARAPRRIALTFDDGPHPARTARVLDLLRAHGVRATFFLSGDAIARGGAAARALVERMVAEGHEVGNHGWSHRSLAPLSAAEVRGEIERCAAAVEAAAGVRPRLLRPPGGVIDLDAIRSAAGLDLDAVVLWDVDPSDWRGGDAWGILDTVARDLRPGSIVLLHDTTEETVRALPVLLEHLRERGYAIVPAGEMLAGDAS